MPGCRCSRDFIVEACDLSSGTVRAVLDPISLDWQTDLNGWGQGSMTLATKDIRIRDIWPGLTSVYISRIAGGGGASPSTPVAEFGGMIESVEASEEGATQVGLVSLEGYLQRRDIKLTQVFDGVEQTEIGAALVRLAESNGIPLFAEAAPSRYPRDRTYEGWSRKLIAEALEEMAQVINGFDWEVVHTRTLGKWTTTMFFRDQVGLDRTEEVRLHSDRELSGYSLHIDGQEQATWVDAIGSGEEEDQLIATATDESLIYPQFDATPAWKDVTKYTTLLNHADGYLEDYREPRATPTITVAGLDPSPAVMRLGDTVHIEQDFGAVTYRGDARIISSSWALGEDEPIIRTYEMLPVTRASQSVLNQQTEGNCRGGC